MSSELNRKRQTPPRLSFTHSHVQTPYSITSTPLSSLKTLQTTNFSLVALSHTNVFIHGGLNKLKHPVAQIHTMDIFTGELQKLKCRNAPALHSHHLDYHHARDMIACLSLHNLHVGFFLNVQNSNARHWVGTSLVNLKDLGAENEQDFEWIPDAAVFTQVTVMSSPKGRQKPQSMFRPAWVTFAYREGFTEVILICLTLFTRTDREDKDRSVQNRIIIDEKIQTEMITLNMNHKPPGRVLNVCCTSNNRRMFVLVESRFTKCIELYEIPNEPWHEWRNAAYTTWTWEKFDVLGGVPPSLSGAKLFELSNHLHLVGGKLRYRERELTEVKLRSPKRLGLLPRKQDPPEEPESLIYRLNLDTNEWRVIVSDFTNSEAPSLSNFFVGVASHGLHYFIGGNKNMDDSPNDCIYRVQNLTKPPPEELSRGLRLGSYLRNVRKKMRETSRDGNDELLDCVILTKDGSVLAHKCILAARSRTFADQLAYTEKDVELGGFETFSKASVEAFLDFLYTCEFEVEQNDFDSFLAALTMLNMQHELSPLFCGEQISLFTHNKVMKKYIAGFDSLLGTVTGVSDMLIEVLPSRTLFDVNEIMILSVEHFQRALTMEGMMERQEGIIRVDDIEPDAMEVLLRYIYTGFANITSENCVDVYFAAAAIFFPSLLKVCSDVMTNFVTIENAFDVLSIALSVLDNDLKRKCTSLITSHPEEFPEFDEDESYRELPMDIQNELRADRANFVMRQLKRSKKGGKS